jgi:hypothetical protein
MVAPSLLPDTGMRRRGSFAPDVEAEVFALKPGEVSKITTETGGFVVYRLIRRDTYTLEQVKGEVVTAIYRQKMEGAVKGVLQSVKTELNDQYFAKPTAPRPLPTSGTTVPGSNQGSKRMQSSHSVKFRRQPSRPRPSQRWRRRRSNSEPCRFGAAGEPPKSGEPAVTCSPVFLSLRSKPPASISHLSNPSALVTGRSARGSASRP